MIKLTPIHQRNATELWVNPGDIHRMALRPDCNMVRADSYTEIMVVYPGAEAELWQVSETPEEIWAMIGAIPSPVQGKKPDFNEFGFPEGLRYCLTPSCGKERTPTGFCPECQADIESRCEFCGNYPGSCRCTVGQENDGGPTAETWLNPWVKLQYTDRGAGMPAWDVMLWRGGQWQFDRGHFATSAKAIHALKEESRRMNEPIN